MRYPQEIVLLILVLLRPEFSTYRCPQDIRSDWAGPLKICRDICGDRHVCRDICRDIFTLQVGFLMCI